MAAKAPDPRPEPSDPGLGVSNESASEERVDGKGASRKGIQTTSGLGGGSFNDPTFGGTPLGLVRSTYQPLEALPWGWYVQRTTSCFRGWQARQAGQASRPGRQAGQAGRQIRQTVQAGRPGREVRPGRPGRQTRQAGQAGRPSRQARQVGQAGQAGRSGKQAKQSGRPSRQLQASRLGQTR